MFNFIAIRYQTRLCCQRTSSTSELPQIDAKEESHSKLNTYHFADWSRQYFISCLLLRTMSFNTSNIAIKATPKQWMAYQIYGLKLTTWKRRQWWPCLPSPAAAKRSEWTFNVSSRRRSMAIWRNSCYFRIQNRWKKCVHSNLCWINIKMAFLSKESSSTKRCRVEK